MFIRGSGLVLASIAAWGLAATTLCAQSAPAPLTGRLPAALNRDLRATGLSPPKLARELDRFVRDAAIEPSMLLCNGGFCGAPAKKAPFAIVRRWGCEVDGPGCKLDPRGPMVIVLKAHTFPPGCEVDGPGCRIEPEPVTSKDRQRLGVGCEVDGANCWVEKPPPPPPEKKPDGREGCDAKARCVAPHERKAGDDAPDKEEAKKNEDEEAKKKEDNESAAKAEKEARDKEEEARKKREASNAAAAEAKAAANDASKAKAAQDKAEAAKLDSERADKAAREARESANAAAASKNEEAHTIVDGARAIGKTVVQAFDEHGGEVRQTVESNGATTTSSAEASVPVAKNVRIGGRAATVYVRPSSETEPRQGTQRGSTSDTRGTIFILWEIAP